MTKEKMYRYLGRNGNITSPIKLENIDPIPMIALRASTGKILTNGNENIYAVVIFEDELSDWEEIDDIGQK